MRRFWTAAAIVFLLAGADDGFRFHEEIDKNLHRLVGWDPKAPPYPITDYLDDVIVPVYGVALPAVAWPVRRTLLRRGGGVLRRRPAATPEAGGVVEWQPMPPAAAAFDPPPDDVAVRLAGVTKTYGEHTAVDDVSIDVPAGSCYGFIGPNGSGKTTTLRMIMRILEQTRGDVSVLGETNSDRPNDAVGYLPEERGLYKQMKVRDVLKFYANIKGADAGRQSIQSWLDRLDLGAWADKKVDQLSKGMSQKVQFIATVISSPRLVLLDEVFSGLDPVNREAMTEQILQLRRGGTTVIFSTHDMATAEEMCDRIFMIYKGKKVLDGTLDDVREQYGSDTLRVAVDGADGTAMDALPGVARVRDLGQTQELTVEEGADTQAVLAGLMRLGRVRRFEVTRPNLQDIFVRIARPAAEDVSTPTTEPTHA